MKKSVLLKTVLMLSVMGISLFLNGGEEDAVYPDLGLYTTEGVWGSAPSTYSIQILGRFAAPLFLELDTFTTYVNTFGDIVIFSYEDDNYCKIIRDDGSEIWADTMMMNDYEYVHFAVDEYEVVRVGADKGISVMNGDPFSDGLGCWYAVDQFNNALSTKLFTVSPRIHDSELKECMVIFFYHDNTTAKLTNLNTGEPREIDFDSAEYFRRTGDQEPQVFLVEATQPVSVMTGGGLNGMYVPSINGTFTGRNFTTYQHRWASVPQHCMIIPWEEDTTVVIMTELGNPSNVIKTDSCFSKGDVTMFTIPTETAVNIHSKQDISLAQTEWFGPSQVAFYMARGIDRSGSGLGTEFYLPLQVSYVNEPIVHTRLHVVAFHDGTEITVNRIPRNGGEETRLWTGELDRGTAFCFTNTSDWDDIFHVIADDTVLTAVSTNDRLSGSDFIPVWNVYPEDSTAAESVTEPSLIEMLTPVGTEIILRFSNMPGGFHGRVFDASGREVDEIHSTSQQGTLTWGGGNPSGVYFISTNQTSIGGVHKVVLIR